MADEDELMKERARREERLQQFRQLARDMGQEYERRGLSEEDILAELEKTREDVYRGRYGNK